MIPTIHWWGYSGDNDPDTICVVWSLKEKTCVLKVLYDVGPEVEIVLPWLPFDVSKEQLEKYLILL
jgi:hypothetical protein